MHAVTFRSIYPVLLGGCVLVAVAACGSSGTTTGAAASSSPSSANANRDAYVTCLRDHGAAVPTANASTGAGKPTVSATARADCASLKPKATGNHKNSTAATEAFDTCMTAQGETIPTKQPDPTSTAKATGVDRFLHGLNPDNAKVAAALKVCESKLPSAAVGG
jgi:hypothetical protein